MQVVQWQASSRVPPIFPLTQRRFAAQKGFRIVNAVDSDTHIGMIGS